MKLLSTTSTENQAWYSLVAGSALVNLLTENGYSGPPGYTLVHELLTLTRSKFSSSLALGCLASGCANAEYAPHEQHAATRSPRAAARKLQLNDDIFRPTLGNRFHRSYDRLDLARPIFRSRHRNRDRRVERNMTNSLVLLGDRQGQQKMRPR